MSINLEIRHKNWINLVGDPKDLCLCAVGSLVDASRTGKKNPIERSEQPTQCSEEMIMWCYEERITSSDDGVDVAFIDGQRGTPLYGFDRLFYVWLGRIMLRSVFMRF